MSRGGRYDTVVAHREENRRQLERCDQDARDGQLLGREAATQTKSILKRPQEATVEEQFEPQVGQCEAVILDDEDDLVEDVVEPNYASVSAVTRSRKENPVLIKRKAKLEKQAVREEKLVKSKTIRAGNLVAKRVPVTDAMEIDEVEEIVQPVVAPEDYGKVVKKPKARLPTDNDAPELKKSSNREAQLDMFLELGRRLATSVVVDRIPLQTLLYIKGIREGFLTNTEGGQKIEQVVNIRSAAIEAYIQRKEIVRSPVLTCTLSGPWGEIIVKGVVDTGAEVNIMSLEVA